jgi:hypothetical protein
VRDAELAWCILKLLVLALIAGAWAWMTQGQHALHEAAQGSCDAFRDLACSWGLVVIGAELVRDLVRALVGEPNTSRRGSIVAAWVLRWATLFYAFRPAAFSTTADDRVGWLEPAWIVLVCGLDLPWAWRALRRDGASGRFERIPVWAGAGGLAVIGIGLATVWLRVLSIR